MSGGSEPPPAASRQFVDTNVLVYAVDLTAGAKRAVAASLLEGLWSSRAGCVSVQVLQEFYVAVTRITRPLIVDSEGGAVTAQYACWRTHRPGPEDVLAAIDIHHRHRVSLWDAMIIRSAAQLGCAVLWSEDLSDGTTYDGVLVRNPFLPSNG
ncbi:MAG TPA: PIN domain-containing protein [Bacillota bacterium]|nr:PIN domain-containing protein [Bacillota bacterium]